MDYSASALGWRLDGQFVFGEGNVKPYVGGGIGFYLLDNPPMLQGNYLEDDMQLGVSFQLMGGAKIDLSPNLELDLSLQFQGFLWQDIEYIGYYESTKISMSSSQLTLGAGIAYKF